VKALRELDTRVILVGGVGLVVAIVVAILAVNLLEGSDDTPSGNPDALSEAELFEEVESLGQPVYWVGPQPGAEGYELEVDSGGSISLNYLAKGTPQSVLLTVGTYPVPDAHNSLLDAKESGQGLTLSEYGAYEVLSGAPENAYAVYASTPELQIEVFSPKPGEAGKLANSGALTTLPPG
jgi:hypothetical protein